MFSRPLKSHELQFYEDHHYLVLRQPFSPQKSKKLQEWADELIRWPETPGKWM